MSVKNLVSETDGIFYITITCYKLTALFEITNTYDAVYKWFDHLIEQRHYIIGYVIMPSHVHAIIAFTNTGKSINIIVSNGKRFIAYDLVKRLKEMNSNLILNELNNDLNNTEKKEGKIYGVFETSLIGKSAERKSLFSKN